MPYKRRDDEILVDPVAVLGEEPAPAPYLRPGPAPELPPVEEAVLPRLTAEQEALIHEQVMANVFAALAPPKPEPEPVPEYAVPDDVQAEIERVAALHLEDGHVSKLQLPESMLQPVSFGDGDDEPTLVTSAEDCTACGHPNPVGQKFCGECGARVESVPKWACGHANADTNKFCGECGQAAYARPVMGAGLAVELAAQQSAPVQQFRPKPTHLLTPEEKKAREEQHAAAVRLGQAMPDIEPEPAQTSDTILIHWLEDGMSFAGQVWYRGQEIELDKSNPRYCDPQDGAWRWIHMTEFEQAQAWGKVMFREGPWPGRRYTEALAPQVGGVAVPGDTSGARAQGPSFEELARAEQLEARRRRGVAPMPRGF